MGSSSLQIAPGHEMVCEVSQVGSEVKDFKKGDLVGFGTQRDCCEKCKWCQRGEEEVCPNVQDKGTYGNIGEAIQLQFNNPQNSFSTYQKNLTLKKVLLFFAQGLPLFIL